MLTSSQRGQLRGIIARAAPPWERAAGTYFSPLPGQDATVIDSRTAAWRTAVTDGDAARFDRLLAARGISRADFERAVSYVALRDGTRLPEWGEALVEWMEELADEGHPAPDDPHLAGLPSEQAAPLRQRRLLRPFKLAIALGESIGAP